MEQKLNMEKIKALSLYKQLEKEYGKSTLESLADDLIRDGQIFEEHGNFYPKLAKMNSETQRTYAERAMSEIQYKKLFNLDCKWRAGKVELDIVSSHSFDYYYTLIHECTLIGPVTEAELAAYKEYLFELEGFPEHIFGAFNHEKVVMGGLHNTKEYPKWYRFFDKKFNTGDLLHLNDLVFEHELRCVRKHFEKYKTKSSENFEKAAEEYHAIRYAYETGDFSNIVVSDNDKFLEFASFLKDKKFALQLKAAIESELTTPDLYLEIAYDYLDTLLYDIPAMKQDYDDWQDGINETAAEHLKMHIIKQLDDVYEDYKAGKLNNYPEDKRKKAKDDLDFWQNAYLDGKKKLEGE